MLSTTCPRWLVQLRREIVDVGSVKTMLVLGAGLFGIFHGPEPNPVSQLFCYQ
jgi:hypothetical protein